MFTKFISYLKLAWRYIKGVCSFRHREYDLQFVYDDNMWYIDMPWPGDRYNLAMVAGSNHLLTYLDTKKENRVRVLVRPSKNPLSNVDITLSAQNNTLGCLQVLLIKSTGFQTLPARYGYVPLLLLS